MDDFELAADAVVAGDVTTLRSLLQKEPRLIHARSRREHHATLLHYVAANGVEDERQRTPRNAVEVANVLLESGADVDALADMYGQRCTTMSMLVSSTSPAEAGLQGALVETLLDHGAAFEAPGAELKSALITALAFGFLDTARTLVRRGAPQHGLAEAAGLGQFEDALRLLPAASPSARHIALALSAQHGHLAVVRLLLDAGEAPSRYNPDGFHRHSTPLHQAVWADHFEVVRLLVARGARLDLRDTIHDGTAYDWAVYGGKSEIAEYLARRQAAGDGSTS